MVLNLIVLFLLPGVTTVFAADGDFSMTYRVVKGYEHNSRRAAGSRIPLLTAPCNCRCLTSTQSCSEACEAQTVRHVLYAIYGREGAVSEENEDLYWRLRDRLWQVLESIVPAEGWEWSHGA